MQGHAGGVTMTTWKSSVPAPLFQSLNFSWSPGQSVTRPADSFIQRRIILSYLRFCVVGTCVLSVLGQYEVI